MARAAEEVGFDSLWVGDHLLYRDPVRGPWDAWTTLAWLAGITERIELGPLVACTAFHPPGVLARMAAATHELSGGRLVLGLGCGWNEVEFRAFGLPFDHLVSRFEEAFTIVRRLLAGEHVTFHGRYHRRRRRGAPAEAGDDAEADARRERAADAVDRPAARRQLEHVVLALRQHGRRLRRGERRDRRSRGACRTRPRDARAERLRLRLGRERRRAQQRHRHAGGARRRARGSPRALEQAGADEAILVADPITEASIRSLGTVIPTA